MDQAPRTAPVSAPLPPELRPYVVLHTEAAALPPGSRFGGHWVTAWRSRLPFVQIDRARSWEVGRCIPFAGDSDERAMRTLLGGSACLIAADEAWLPLAAELGTRTIWLQDGHPDAVAPPAALAGFAPDRLRVLRADSNFRRDLPLRLVNEALEHFVPGVTGSDRSESSLCRQRLLPFLRGAVADLGHGGHKITRDAIGVDFFKFDAFDWIGDVRDLWFFRDQSFDTVYSSHCLEDLWHPHQALAEWTRVLRPGGHLALFLPLRDFYPNVGTEGANPGHKDDYVPADVEGFLRDLGGVEIVHSARVERENSFEVVARKKAGRSFFLARDQRPRPTVSVLLVADPSGRPAADGNGIVATVAAAQAALRDVPHEVLVLDRTRADGDQRAAVQDLAARDGRVHVITDRSPQPFGARWERLRRTAAGEFLLVLAPGALLAPDAGSALLAAMAAGAGAAVPAGLDPLGHAHDQDATARCCLLLPAAAWPIDALRDTPWTTDRLWAAFARRRAAVTAAGARVVTAGPLGRPTAALGLCRAAFDQGLAEAGADPIAPTPATAILVVMLRTLGDCVLSTPVLDGLRRRHPDARIDVLTEHAYAWIFRHHPAVDSVIAVSGLPDKDMAWAEDRTAATALAGNDYDRLVLLSDRLESVSYHHSGLTLAGFYAVQAGVPEVAEDAPRVTVPAAAAARWAQLRAERGIPRTFAVLHTRAGWAEKSLPAAISRRIASELAAAGLSPVVIGGPGESVDHPSVHNLAGALTPAESAAAIAEAALFVGPDSGPLHLASAFGVRSLALYGGSHLRVAPPRARGSCSVQAPTCCAVPCGVTPCAERHCGAGGLAVDAVLPRLRELLATAGTDAAGEPIAEFWGSEPVLCAASADGPALVAGQRERFAGTPVLPPIPATPSPPATPRATPAPLTSLQLDLGPRALLLHMQAARQAVAGPARPAAAAADAGALLEAIRDGVTPEDGLEVLRALAAQCRTLAAAQPTLQVLAAAIAHAGAMARGERGRPRPAFRLRAGELLHEAIDIFVPEPSGSLVREQLFTLHREATGEEPGLAHVLHALHAAGAGVDDERVRGQFRQLLLDALRGRLPHHAEVLQQAAMLRRAEDPASAAALLDAHLAALPPAAAAERAEARFVRGTCLAALDRPAAALPDMEFAAAHLRSAADRGSAAEIVAVLRRHLAATTSAPA